MGDLIKSINETPRGEKSLRRGLDLLLTRQTHANTFKRASPPLDRSHNNCHGVHADASWAQNNTEKGRTTPPPQGVLKLGAKESTTNNLPRGVFKVVALTTSVRGGRGMRHVAQRVQGVLRPLPPQEPANTHTANYYSIGFKHPPHREGIQGRLKRESVAIVCSWPIIRYLDFLFVRCSLLQR